MVFAGKEAPSVILVLGAEGMLGTTLCPSLSAMGYRVLRQSRRGVTEVTLDPLNGAAVAAALSAHQPYAVINLIAESNVDACQMDIQRAYLANVRTVENLVSAMAAGRSTAHLIQISTDHVYNGVGPHEESTALPGNVYALTKYAGELAALRAGATVIRTNFFGRSRSSSRISFSDWVVNSLRSKAEFTVFEDVYFSALHMTNLTQYVAQVIRQRHSGVFNVGCKDGLSKAEFAQSLARSLGLDTAGMKIGSVKDVPLSASRPSDMRMDIHSFERSFSVEMPCMAEQIALAVGEYGEYKC
jgi:dTDP-4-dehydrorhamnose reductase